MIQLDHSKKKELEVGSRQPRHIDGRSANSATAMMESFHDVYKGTSQF